ncbi:unnamed protein product [Clonostachys rosea f. rosea IK726]|jgi:hypothetical protein|uniref:Uncharacterized protein n=1 Tax=Clonostachys rosea f. rosea IK726 TaxID=1349383 RepID=A0ACA9TF70_BIOOC|nr:unnamed protein product [Clonostachys rosea f. rosea IK726]
MSKGKEIAVEVTEASESPNRKRGTMRRALNKMASKMGIREVFTVTDRTKGQARRPQLSQGLFEGDVVFGQAAEDGERAPRE